MTGPECAIPYPLLMAIQSGTMAWRYRGRETFKNPFDLAQYSRLIGELRPATVLEIGSHAGGSAIWFADQMRAHGITGAVHSLDLVAPEAAPPTDASDAVPVTFHAGDARAIASAWPSAWLATLPRPWLVVEDADHHAITTTAVLDHFDPLLHRGDWMVVEDGILTAMGVADDYGGGPLAALDAFMARRGSDYRARRDYCDFYGSNVTWNVDGWLERL